MSKTLDLQKRLNDSGKALLELRSRFDAEQKGGEWTAEQNKNWDDANNDFNAIDAELKGERSKDKIDARSKEIEERLKQPNNPHGIGRHDSNDRSVERSNEKRSLALRSYLRASIQRSVDSDQLEAMQECGFNAASSCFEVDLFNSTAHSEMRKAFRHGRLDAYEQRALSATNPAKGGALVPSSFLARLEMNMLYFGGMLQTAEVITTDSGEILNLPSMDDTGNTGSLVSENGTQTDTTDPATGVLKLSAYEYTSNIVRIPRSLIDDSAYDIESALGMALAERIGRIVNTHCTTGDGASKPSGLVDATTKGADAASATTISYDNLIDLFHSVDKAYRDAPTVGWMMRDTTVGAVRKLKDGASQYIWKPGASAESPESILNKPVYTNNDVAAIATTNKSVLFGDLGKYKIRRVSKVTINRLVELYAAQNQIGFNIVMRFDGGLLDAGTKPVKHILHG
jgi:HK97 family phage major capsid protein